MVAHYGLYLVASIQGDTTSMAHHVAWATGKSGEGVMLYFQAETAAFSGRRQKASTLLRAAADVEKSHKFEGRAANWQAITALMQAEFGNASRARLDATAVLAAAKGSDARIVLLLALACSQDEKRAEALANDLARQFPADTIINGLWLPAARAQIEIDRGNPGRAIQILQAAVPYELGVHIPPLPHLYAVYLRGQAYLAARQSREAAAEFQKILDHRSIAGDSPLYSLAHLGLARAYSNANEKEKSRKAYEDFFALWKDADPDIPILKQAKAEYTNLH
jgi:tetratricopeptide (TPR) repeat protein